MKGHVLLARALVLIYRALSSKGGGEPGNEATQDCPDYI